MTIELTEWDSRNVLEALCTLEEKWLNIIRNSTCTLLGEIVPGVKVRSQCTRRQECLRNAVIRSPFGD